jgi:hypothetical protein
MVIGHGGSFRCVRGAVAARGAAGGWRSAGHDGGRSRGGADALVPLKEV